MTWVHATAVLVAETGILIRGSSGTGKTALALALITQSRAARRFSRLVADDTVGLQNVSGRVVARPHPRTAGLVERRGFGIVRVEHEPACVLGLIVDLVAPDSEPFARLPEPPELRTQLLGATLPRVILLSTGSALDNSCRVLEVWDTFRPGS